MRRREFIAFLGGAAAAVFPRVARAQTVHKVLRIGFLWDSPVVFPEAMDAFRQEIRNLGYVEGQSIIIEHRWAGGRPERIRELAEELVRLKVDVIVAPSSIYTGAARQATSSIPIVFFSHADPLGSGHVDSLAQPGGNATGLSLMMTETNVKILELLKDALHPLARVAVVWDPATPSHRPGLRALEVSGPSLALEIKHIPVRSADEYDSAFAVMTKDRADAVLFLSTPLYTAGARHLADLSLAHKLPSAYAPREHVEAGGFLSYGPDRVDLWRRGAAYVDRILKGEKPENLPVQQPTKFELAVNLSTAKALGITISEAFLLRADKVIE
jgi:putative ABC transport system substrate-binding protein